MGLIEKLIKRVDPPGEEERGVAAEQPKRDDAVPPPLFVCRVCGHRSADGSYCPQCLAQTMERATR